MARPKRGPRKAIPILQLYSKVDRKPSENFNTLVFRWLRDEQPVAEHSACAAFAPVRALFDAEIATLLAYCSPREAHRELLSRMTPMLLQVDIGKHLKARLLADLINETGFRSQLTQGQAKNNGENFVNAIVYSLASLLGHQDEILIDKGTPPPLREVLRLDRTVNLGGKATTLTVPIECDFAIFSRANPLDAIVVSAKTRLKEVFHIGTMWKLFFDMVGDRDCEKKWSLQSHGSAAGMQYCFATADMIPLKGKRTQGPDVERGEPRNLIKLDASFFDYVFVSKAGIPHVSNQLALARPREALFHELGCLVDLVEQKFGISLAHP